MAKSVHVYVSRLRKQLGEDRLLTRAPGYVLRVEPAELDADRFERLVAEAAQLGPRGRRRCCARRWLSGAVPRSASSRTSASRSRRWPGWRSCAWSRSSGGSTPTSPTGATPTLVGELEALVAEHPLREGLHGRLMLALYRCGRQAEALAAFATARAALVDELGIEPGRGLRELHQAILVQDRGLDLAPPQPGDPRRPAFVGREPELADLRAVPRCGRRRQRPARPADR